MIRRHETLAGISLSVMLGCGAVNPPDSGVTPKSCASSEHSAMTVVGCELAPRVALLGADEEAFYVVSGNRTWFRVARDTGRPTKLHHSLAFSNYMGEATTQLFTTSFLDGKIYLLDTFIKDRVSHGGIMSLDARNPGSPTLLIDTQQDQGAAFIVADGYAYFRDRLFQPDRVPEPLVRTPLGGGASQVLYTHEEVEPFAVHGGYVYFIKLERGIGRVPITGGTENLVLAKLPRAPEPARTWITSLDLAVDDDYLYVPFPSSGGGEPHTIRRFAVTGGDSGTVVASISWHPEVPVDPPTTLRVDGDYLYFIVQNGLNRIKLGGDGQIKYIGATKAPPVFDASSIYVTDQIGGEDSPLEGVIVKFPK